MERSHGEIVFLRTRFISLVVAEAPTWGCTLVILPPVKRELLYWKEHLIPDNGMHIFASAAAAQIVYTDASGTGCASVCTTNPNCKKLIVNRVFTQEEIATSSTERELLAVLHGLIQLKELLQGCTVNWNTDSKNVARITKRGSMKPYLINLAVAIFQIARKHKITLNVIWIPRSQNEEADLWSRVQDFNDWGIDSDYVQQICSYFQIQPTIDRFADSKNKKFTRFNSRFYHKESEAVDCFTQHWGAEINWLVPPIYLVNKALQYAQLCKAEIVLVIPAWKSAVYWPRIACLLKNEQGFLIRQATLGNIYTKGSTESSIFGSKDWRGDTLALHIKFY